MRKIPYFISAILLIVFLVVSINLLGHRGLIPHDMLYGTEGKWFLLASFCAAGLFFSIGVFLDIFHNFSERIKSTAQSPEKQATDNK